MPKIISAEAIISAKDNTGGAFASVARKLTEVQRKVEVVNSKMAASASALAGRVAAIAGPVALAAGAAKAVGEFAELERKMTRIAITAETSGDAVKLMTKDVQRLAIETAMPTENVAKGLDALVAQGKSLPEALSLLPSVAKAAQASGAEMDDMSKSAGALSDHLKISAKDMERAFDVLVGGGKMGQFELKDAARYLPSILPQAAAAKMKGIEGLRSLEAMLQVVRKGSGSAEEAASSVPNIFTKMESNETVKNFKKFGIDLPAQMKKARAEGKNLIEVFTDLTAQATKGDLSIIPRLMPDMEFARGMRAMVSLREEYERFKKGLKSVDGAVLKDFNTVLATTKTSIDRATESWHQLVATLGERLSPAAAATLDAINTTMNSKPPIENTLYPNAAPAPDTDAPVRDYTSLPAARGQEAMDRFERLHGPSASGRVKPSMRSMPAARGTEARARFEQREGPRGFGEAKQAERSVPDQPDYFNAYGPSTWQAAEQRRRAIASGGMTPGMSIEKEREIEASLKRQKDAFDYYRRRAPNTPEDVAIDRASKKFGTRESVEELDRLEAARTGRPRSTGPEIEKKTRETLIGGGNVKAEVSGTVQVTNEVKITAGDGLVATIVSKVVEVIGPRLEIATNAAKRLGGSGPGSTGTSFPSAEAPVHNVGRGDR